MCCRGGRPDAFPLDFHKRFKERVHIIPDTMTEEKTLEEKTMEEYLYPQVDVQQAIVWPIIKAESYEINLVILQIIIQDYRFNGNLDEDPYDHISNLLDICYMFKLKDISEDEVRLLLFPFTLRNKAKEWLQSLPANSITM